MKTSFQVSPTGPVLTVLQRISNFPSTEHLLLLSQRSAFLSTYKHFYRLRHLVSLKPYNPEHYCRLLRRRYLRSDFNLRRKKVLGISEDLSHEELIKRLHNTYVFVFNSTCHAIDEPDPVRTYEDYKSAMEPRFESKILDTILKLDELAPSQIKFDLDYNWFDKAREVEEELSLGTLTKQRARELNRSREVVGIGYADYERSIMALNESLDLCL